MINIKSLIRPNILELQPYSSAKDEFSGSDAIFLDANENPYGNLNRYPDPYQNELKQIIANQKNINLNSIFVGNGSDELIDLAFRIFCQPGIDRALTFSPTYGMYDISANINDISLIKLPLTAEFQIDLKAVVPYLDDRSIKLIIICSPNNPTGNSMNQKDIEFILNNFKGIVLLDEAYIDFSGSSSLLGLIEKYNNLIVIQTLSKAKGLAAARVGLAFTNPEIISFYNKVKPPYNVSTLNQRAAITALNNERECDKYIQVILEEKEQLKMALLQLDLVKKIYPSDTNFLLVEVTDADGVYQKLVNQKIIIRNRTNQVANCIRITIGTPQENGILIKALKDYA